MTEFIGIPFEDRGSSYDGSDCYGLIRLIYRDKLNIDLQEFNGSCYDVRGIFLNYVRKIDEDWRLVKEYEPFDVVAMTHDPNHPKIIQHFGLYLGDGKVLHTLENIGSHVVQLSDLNYYVKGVYRWKHN